ncbi:MAG: protein translocase subunit SecF, partial [Gammaproteobacteria bacterium]|nr:protein translocase subunit SecF [Gammaproteobacteria bacterium]
MELFTNTKIDFLGKRKMAIGLSVIVLLISVASMATRGMNLGLDFSGGTLLEVGYQQAADLDVIRGTLEQAGFDEAVVQHFGSAKEVLIKVGPRTEKSSAELSSDILRALQQADNTVDMRRVEYVGPQIGEELREDGGLAMLYAIIGIMIYVALRFEYRFALGSVAALVHGVEITLGI